MSEQEFDITKADKSRIKQITSTYENLSLVAKELCLCHLSAETLEHYPRKFKWSEAENNALRLFWNRTSLDELCDAFECSDRSVLSQAQVLGLIESMEERLNSDHVYKVIKFMEAGESPKSVAQWFGIEYDYKETLHVGVDVREKLEMKQNELFGGE